MQLTGLSLEPIQLLKRVVHVLRLELPRANRQYQARPLLTKYRSSMRKYRRMKKQKFKRNLRATSAKGSPENTPSPKPFLISAIKTLFSISFLSLLFRRIICPIAIPNAVNSACEPKINSAENSRKGPTLSTSSLNVDRSNAYDDDSSINQTMAAVRLRVVVPPTMMLHSIVDARLSGKLSLLLKLLPLMLLLLVVVL